MRTINRLNIYIILIAITFSCKAKSDFIENWKNQILSDMPSAKMDSKYLAKSFFEVPEKNRPVIDK
jgi:hypothetical protein